MSDRKYSLILLESNKQNKNDDLEYDEKIYKNKARYKINNYEKFRPKVLMNNEDNDQTLKGAENQVKSLLSYFLRNFQSDKPGSDIIYKPMNSLKNAIESEQNSSKKKSIKRIRTITYKKNSQHRYSNKINNNIIKNKNQDIFFSKKNNTLKALYSHKNVKKVNFSISPRVKKRKVDSQKVANNFKFNKSNKITNGLYRNVPTLNLESITNKDYKINNNNFHSGKNLIKAYNHSNSNKVQGYNVNSLIKKTQTQGLNNNVINFKSDDLILYNNESKDKKNNKFSSIKNFVNNLANNIKQININKIAGKDSPIKNSKISRIQTDDKNLFFVSNKIQRCFSPTTKKSSLFRKNQLASDKNEKKLDTQNNEMNFKGINNIKNKKTIKRAETSKDNLNKNIQDEDKIKFLNLISNFKSIKNKIKQRIILRPEDQEESKKDQKKVLQKKKQLSSDKLIHLKNMDIEQTPKSKNDITHSNTIVYMGEENKEPQNKSENEIKDDKTNEEKSNIDNQQTQKSESLNEQYSTHSIQRKNALHFEKYRMLSHKGVIYDSLDDEELEDEEDINKFYIDPNSNFCFYFDLILFLITIITFYDVPLYLAHTLNFCKSNKFSINDTLNLLNELMNVLDFIFGFFRAFYNWEEQLVKKNDTIAKKYLFGWCLFDIISAIPVYSLTKMNEPVCNDNTNALYYNVVLNNIHYLFLCNRLLKFLKIFSDNQAWKYISNRLSEFWSVIFNIFLIVLALNYTACLYIFIARNSYPNWILKAGLEITEFKNIYICAIYILLMALTTVGYGDITCCSLHERIFQVFLLIIGIMAYSWIVSSFSNFVKKLNEKSVDFEKKKNILDEIKINNPNLPDELYDNIIRYLKFKHFHEKNLKNIIFDCLPVGLKNNLIYEMYKPIIKNFIFFKNFQNTDFIVQVILSFKPILAYKNYVLVNEGDLIEEVIFVKHGVLSVELPINMTNPQENIEKYLKEKEKEKSRLENTKSQFKNDILGSFIKDTPTKLLSFNNTSTINSSYKYKSSYIGNSALTKAKTVKIEKAYVRILCIRENEHFGDVLMFLEERSPLQVRVRSKKSELFFLRKIDALKISTSYPNIWRRINKKSVYNFKQIKKNIKKIVEIYCSAKKVSEKSSEDNSVLNSVLADEFGLKKTGRWVRPKNYDFNNSALKSTYRNHYEKQNKSEEDLPIKPKNFFENKYGIDDDYFNDVNIKNKLNNLKKCHSIKIKKTKFENLFFPQSQLYSSRFSFSDSSSSSDIIQQLQTKKKVKRNSQIRKKKKKLTKKLTYLVNQNKINYLNSNQNNEDYPFSIIQEETDKECSLNPILNNGNNNSVYKNSINSKAKMLENESIKQNNKKGKKENKKKKNHYHKEKQNLFGLNDIKIDNYQTINNGDLLFNSSLDVIEDSKENNDDNDYLKINNEIYPGELIQVNNETNLFDKKFDYNLDYNIETNYNLSTNIDINNRNKEVSKLLKYFDNESKSIHDNNISHKASSYIKSSKNLSKNRIYSNKLIFNHDDSSESSKNKLSSINLNLKTNWDNNILSIKNDISLTINSSYENYNSISGDKLIKSKFLQSKLKEYLISESLNLSGTDLRNTGIKKTNTLEQNMKLKEDKKKSILKNLSQKKRVTSSIVYNTTNINYINKVSFMKQKTKKTIRQSSSLINRNNSIISYSDIENASINVKADNNKKVNFPNKNDNKHLEKEFIQSSKNNIKFNRLGRKKASMPYIKSTNNIKHFDISHHKSFNIFDGSLTGRALNYETTKEIPRRSKLKRRSMLIRSISKTRRKKEDNLLNLIDYNIQRTNQKLNDPDAFYNNYFNNILKEEKEKNKKKQ